MLQMKFLLIGNMGSWVRVPLAGRMIGDSSDGQSTRQVILPAAILVL
jgi:hypothetical protein